MEGESNSFFDINVIFLKYGGVSPPKSKSNISRGIYNLFRFFTIITTFILCPIQFVIGGFVNMSDLNILIEHINIGLSILLIAFKGLFWLINADSIGDIMETLENTEFDYEQTDSFKPSLVKEQAKRNGRKCTVIFCIFVQLTIGFPCLPGIFLSIWYHLNNLPIANVAIFRNLPYYTYIPIAYDTAAKYCLASIVQVTPLYLFANITVGFDTLFMNMLNLIGAHMLILQRAFKTMRERCSKKITGPHLSPDGLHNSDELEYYMMLEMKKSIKHLQMLYQCCDKIEEIYKFASLFQALAAVFIMCSSLLMLSTASGMSNKQLGNQVAYFLGINFQMGLYCTFGNEVTLKVLELPRAIWENDWLESRQPYKMSMLITMIRLKKPIYLTAGKFAPLLLSTHISALKCSYSYYTVLKSIDK